MSSGSRNAATRLAGRAWISRRASGPATNRTRSAPSTQTAMDHGETGRESDMLENTAKPAGASRAPRRPRGILCADPTHYPLSTTDYLLPTGSMELSSRMQAAMNGQMGHEFDAEPDAFALTSHRPDRS